MTSKILVANNSPFQQFPEPDDYTGTYSANQESLIAVESSSKQIKWLSMVIFNIRLTTTRAALSNVDSRVHSFFEGANLFLCNVTITLVMDITTSTNKQGNINGI